MKLVIQEEPEGCGIASVAMIAGVSYQHAKDTANSIGIFAGDKKLWSQTGYVRHLLQEYSIPASQDETPFTSWDKLPDIALISLKWKLEESQPFWHWSVFYRSESEYVVFDPAMNLEKNEKTDFETMSPKWFIEIGEI
jgi:ABC-type bacteriocin/lantibiotic exporter with double-glycine peptidase domain